MENAEIIHSVVTMIVADGKIKPQEIEFLKHLCQRLEVPADVVEQAFGNVVQNESYVYLPQNEDEKKRLFNNLLEAMVADREIAPQERELLKAVAARMGIPQQHVERMLTMLLRRAVSESASEKHGTR